MIEYPVIIIASLIGIVPALIIGWVILKNNKNGKGLGGRLLLTTIFWGVLTAVPASILQIINIEQGNGYYFIALFQGIELFRESYFLSQTVLPLLFVAIVEEFSKWLGIVLALRSFAKSKRARNIKINPGLITGVLVGLAFGITENGVYFANNFGSQTGQGMAQIIILRFVLSTSAHIVYSGLLGAFLVDAMVAKSVGVKILKIAVAVLIPVMIHTLFNLLVSTQYGILVVPLTVVGLVTLAGMAFWRKDDKE